MITLVRTILMRRKVSIKDHVSRLGVDGTVHSVDMGTRLAKLEDRLAEAQSYPGESSSHPGSE